MGSTFILKRKNYNSPNSSFDFLNGQKVKGEGFIKGSARSLVTSPIGAVGMVAGSANNAVKDTLNDYKDVAENYTPTVQNSFVQPKNYSVVQAGKEIATGIGKGVFNWGKSNKKSLASISKFGAALGAGTYGVNRLQRQKAEVDRGDREATGMSTGGKAIAAGTAVGTGALVAKATGKSHDKAVTKVTEQLAKDKALLNEANSKGLTKISEKANKNIAEGTKNLEKLSGKRLGISKKAMKMGRNGLLAGGVLAGAGLLANSMLKQKENSLKAAGLLAKRVLGGKSVTQNLREGNIGTVGKAAGTYLSGASKSLVKGASNFFTPGKSGAKGVVNSVGKSLREQGEYGKKAADLIGRHKTAAGLVAVGGVGSTSFNLANKIGEKPVELVSKMDKKTTEYVKSKEL